MVDSAPVVYLLHGEDEFAIAQFVSEIEAKLGDSALASLNVTHLDGRSYNPEELMAAACAIPFLAKRRMVLLSHPLARLTSLSLRQNFLKQMEQIPPTTAMVLVEYKTLTDGRDRRRGKVHWLEKWALANEGRVYLRSFPLPRGGAMGRWIQERAQKAGGKFTPQAAVLLGSLVGDDPRLADQEIRKLLAYANYQRPVEPEDVEKLTADYGQGDIFTMVDALGNRDGKQAIAMLHRLFEEQDPFSIFGMIVRQFRLLLLAKEVMDRGGQEADITRELKIHPYVAAKMKSQARYFSLPLLEAVYHRLLEVDTEMKTGQTEGELALDLLVTTFTNQLN